MGIGIGIGTNWGKVSLGGGAAPNLAFEFTVQTDNAGTSAADQFTIPITSATPYDISTSDGHNITGATGATTLTFSAPGTYTVSITNSCDGWQFNNGGDKDKFIQISNWGVFNASATTGIFRGCSNFTTISATDAPTITAFTLQYMFYQCTSLSGALDFSNWDVSSLTQVAGAGVNRMFNACSSLTSVNLSGWTPSGHQYMDAMFANCTNLTTVNLSGWTKGSFSAMRYLFQNCTNLSSVIGFETFDVSNCTLFDLVFSGALLFNQDISGWNMSGATSINNMFFNAQSFNQPIGSWVMPSLNNIGSAFYNATSFNQDVSSWDISACTNLQNTFRGCSSFNQPLNSWNTTGVTTIRDCFNGATVFDQPLNNWDTSSITGLGMLGTFNGANAFNQDIGGWNTSGVTNISFILQNAFNFDQDISSWDINQVTTMSSLLQNGQLSTANYDALLVAWEAQVPQNGVVVSFGSSQYTLGGAAEAARNTLTTTYGWTITDGGGV